MGEEFERKPLLRKHERFSARQFQTHICISEKSLVEGELGVGELTLEGRQRRVSTEALGGTRS